MDDQMQRALAEREQLITQRAQELAREAAEDSDSWAASLAQVITDPRGTAIQLRLLAVVAAYRDRYGITSRSPLGSIPGTDAQRIDYERAQTALATLRTTTETPETLVPEAHGKKSAQRRL